MMLWEGLDSPLEKCVFFFWFNLFQVMGIILQDDHWLQNANQCWNTNRFKMLTDLSLIDEKKLI